MNKLISIRQIIKGFYISKEPWVTPILKALIMLLTILVINSKLGYNESLSQWNVILLLILVAALLPWNGIAFLTAGVLLVNLLSLSWEVAAITAAFLLVIAITQYLFLPGFSIAIVLVPLAFGFKMPFVIPLVLGLVGGTLSFIPTVSGVFLYYFLIGVEKNADLFGRTTGSAAGALERFPQIIAIVKENDVMLISIIAFAAITVIVSVIRRISTDFSTYVALAVGTISGIIIYLIGGFTSNIAISFLSVFGQSILSFVLSVISAFWLLAGDYGHAQYLQFEDENYIYHVKAVPKIRIKKKTVKVHDISEKTEEDENKDLSDALKALDEIDAEERRKEEK